MEPILIWIVGFFLTAVFVRLYDKYIEGAKTFDYDAVGIFTILCLFWPATWALAIFYLLFVKTMVWIMKHI